jgi:hypothetical protein
MRRLFLSVLIAALALTAAAASTEIPGLTKLLNRPGLRYVVVGDLHGTEQLPAFFGQLVEEISARKPVSVILEYPERFRRDLDTYLASSGDAAARKAFLATDFWTRWHDGRSSKAMFALIEKLRTLEVPVTACQPYGSDLGEYERVMGECWKQVGEDTHRLVLIFVGNAHASYMPVFNDVVPAAASLPRDATASFDNFEAPGWAWNCDKPDKCGESPSHADSDLREPGLYFGEDLVPVARGVFDGAYSAGPRFTASPPAAEAR